MSLRVRYLLLWNVKRGPVEVGCTEMYCRKARTGHNIVSFAARRIVIPWRNGSVLEAFISMWAMPSARFMLSKRRVTEGSNFVLWVEVYSDTRRKPKKAVVMAAQIMSLSSYNLEELNRFSCMV